MKKHFITFEFGFTLVETLMSLVIGSFLLIALFGALSQAMHSYRTSERTLYNIKDSRKAFDTIISELRTSSIIVPATKSVNYFYTDGDPATTDVSSTIFLDNNGIVYYQRNISDASSKIAITNLSATDFSVTDLGSGVYNIAVSFTNGVMYSTKIKQLNK